MPSRPVITYTFLGACCVLFLLGPASGFLPAYGSGAPLESLRDGHFRRWGLVPGSLGTGAGSLLTPLSALFLHVSWPHLLGNMLFLLVFGSTVEARMGRLRFACFYLAAGYLSMLGYALVHDSSREPLVGASGAVSAVLGAFLYLAPRARVTSIFPFLLFLPLRFPAWTVLVLWIGLQWLATRGDDGGPGVAHLAHVVGFTLGFLYAWWHFRTAKVGGPAPATP